MTPEQQGGSPPQPSPGAPQQPAGRAAAPPRPKRRRGRVFWFAAGLLLGLIVGVGGGYVLFNGKNTTITSGAASSQRPSPSAVASPSATAGTAQPIQTPAPTPPVGLVPCPVATPDGQHQLGAPGSPGQGQTQNPALDFCGGGTATIPAGTAPFTTNAGWGLGISDSCPVTSSGEGGANTVLTVTEIAAGGGPGPDPPVTETGDHIEGASATMPSSGSYRLLVSAVSPSCVWQVNVYTT